MDAIKATRRIVDSSGKSVRTIGAELGRSPTYLSSILTRGSVPKADTLASIADACGYDLQLASRDGSDVITIDGRQDG